MMQGRPRWWSNRENVNDDNDEEIDEGSDEDSDEDSDGGADGDDGDDDDDDDEEEEEDEDDDDDGDHDDDHDNDHDDAAVTMTMTDVDNIDWSRRWGGGRRWLSLWWFQVMFFLFGKHWTHLVAGSSGSQSPAGAFANA